MFTKRAKSMPLDLSPPFHCTRLEIEIEIEELAMRNRLFMRTQHSIYHWLDAQYVDLGEGKVGPELLRLAAPEAAYAGGHGQQPPSIVDLELLENRLDFAYLHNNKTASPPRLRYGCSGAACFHNGLLPIYSRPLCRLRASSTTGCGMSPLIIWICDAIWEEVFKCAGLEAEEVVLQACLEPCPPPFFESRLELGQAGLQHRTEVPRP